MTFRDLGTALRRFWLLALAVVAGVVALGAVAAFLPSERFQSTVTVFLQPQSRNDFDFGAQQVVQYLVPPVISRIDSSEFDSTIRASMGTKGDSLIELKAENEPGTGILTLNAVASTADAAELAAGSAANEISQNPVSELVTTEVLNPATDAESISASRRLVIIFGSIVLGLIAAIFSVVAAYLLRPRTSSAKAVTERFGLPVIGEIPYKRRVGYRAAARQDSPGSLMIDDAFQKLAVNVEILTNQNATIAVTSWGQGEGKTMVSARLSWALASLGHQLLAVDCDLRNPSLHEGLAVDPRGGLADIALGREPTAMHQHTILDELDVIAAGELGGDSSPAEVVSTALPAIQHAFADRTIVIDTPPLFAAETSVIAAKADYVLLVVDSQRTQPEQMRIALRDLEMANANVLGAVLNRTRTEGRNRRAGYYYREHPARRVRV